MSTSESPSQSPSPSPVRRRESPWGLPEGDHRQPKPHRCNDRAEDVIQVFPFFRTLIYLIPFCTIFIFITSVLVKFNLDSCISFHHILINMHFLYLMLNCQEISSLLRLMGKVSLFHDSDFKS